MKYSDGDPLTRAPNARGYEKLAMFDQDIAHYVGNDTRWSHSYYIYGLRIGNLR